MVFEILENKDDNAANSWKRKFLFTKFRSDSQKISIGSDKANDCIFDNSTISPIHAYLTKKNGKIFIQPQITKFGTSKYTTNLTINPHQEQELKIGSSLLSITLRKEFARSIPPKSQIGIKRKFAFDSVEDIDNCVESNIKRKFSSTGIKPNDEILHISPMKKNIVFEKIQAGMNYQA